MIELALLASLLVEHNASHWEMSCSDWNQKRIEILSDKNLNSDAHEYLIDYFVQSRWYDYIIIGPSKPTRNGFVHPYVPHSS